MPTGTKNLTETFAYDDLNRLIRNEIAGASNPHNCNGNDVSYNGLGNITCKGNLTNYQYGTNAGPHAVTRTTANGINTGYTYDNNGNQTSDGNDVLSRKIEYTSYDLVKRISKGSGLTSDLKYGPDRMRWQRKDLKGGITTTTTYLGNLERIQSSGNSAVVEWKRYVGGSIFTYKLDGTMTPLQGEDSYDRRYTYTDHLGSLDVITNSRGTGTVLTNRLSYDAWGSRRNGNTWGAISASDITAELAISSYGGTPFTQPVTTRGFTGHEMAEDFGIINMNGRIYDPKLGRFLQADSFIDGIKDTQGYNRYSYVHNNPLNATDPSGFLSLGSIFKVVAIVAISAFTYGAASTWAIGAYGAGCVTACSLATASLLGGIAGGAAAGFVGASLGAAFNGANFGQALKAGIQGGFAGGFSGGFSAGLTGGTAGSTASSSGGILANRTPIEKMFVNAIVKGTISEATGSKFANGALSSVAEETIQSAVLLIGAGGSENGELTLNPNDACSFTLMSCDFGGSDAGDTLYLQLTLYNGAQKTVENADTAMTIVSAVTGVGAIVRGAGMAVESVALRQAAKGMKPANFSPLGSGRSGAFNEAKRQSGIPTSQQPSRVLQNLDKRGSPQPGRVYEYEVPAPGGGTKIVRVRDDAGGHDFGPKNIQNRGPHFNDEAGNHYDY